MITKEYLLKTFDYKDGELYWKTKPSSKIKIGEKAGSLKSTGYVDIKLHGKMYGAHRFIFLMHHGYLPKEVDHIKGKSNKIENLRAADTTTNQYNRNMQKNNISGIKGICWHKASSKWIVQLRINNQVKYFGTYNDIDYAKFVVKAMRYKYHGKFAKQ